jgi:hypothetical protein
MTKTLTHADIKDALRNFAAAIKLDQRRVDGMPAASFHPMYNAKMWRDWRSKHVDYIENLLPSIKAMPLSMLMELTDVALTYERHVVQLVVLENFADAVSGACCEEEFATAERFFGWVIKGARLHASVQKRRSSVKNAVARWLPAVDPLRITRDPECQYRLHPAR